MKISPFVLFLLVMGFIQFVYSTPISAQGDGCFATPLGSDNINTRGGPGAEYPDVDLLLASSSIMVTGQRIGADGLMWWRTFSGGWVLSEMVALSGNCNAIPSVEAPPNYCTTRTELSPRPILSGTEKRIGTARFVVHYTTSGIDATTDEIAQIAANTLELALDIQVDDMGWAMPPPDCGEGGDERFDLYIHSTEDGIAGYAVPNHIIGDNPLSPEIEQYAAYGHLVISNNFPYTADPIGYMKTTIAHEVHHNIQFTYGIGSTFSELDEAGATWMETQVFPQNQDAMQYVDDYIYFSDLCLGYGGGEHSLRIYGEWLLIDSIVKDHGADFLHRVLWRYRANLDGMETFYQAFESIGDDASNIIFRASVRNLLRSYTLSYESLYRVYIEGIVNGIGKYRPRRDGIQELGVDYLRIADLGRYQYTLTGDNLYMAIVGIRGAEANIFYVGASGTVDLTLYDDAYIILLNLTRRADNELCRYNDWNITVTDGSSNWVSPDTEYWDATFFEPPIQTKGTERYIGRLDDTNDYAEYRLFLKAGDVLNVYAGVTMGVLDTLILLTDPAGLETYAEDDDSGGGYNSYFSYIIPADGEYLLMLTSAVPLAEDTDYEVIIAINEEIQR